MHAVLCTSAVHLANWAVKVNDQDKGVHFAELAAQHRAQALHLLRIASAKEEKYDEEVNAATLVLLLLSGVSGFYTRTHYLTVDCEAKLIKRY